jgi:hypothetical protein
MRVEDDGTIEETADGMGDKAAEGEGVAVNTRLVLAAKVPTSSVDVGWYQPILRTSRFLLRSDSSFLVYAGALMGFLFGGLDVVGLSGSLEAFHLNCFIEDGGLRLLLWFRDFCLKLCLPLLRGILVLASGGCPEVSSSGIEVSAARVPD